MATAKKGKRSKAPKKAAARNRTSGSTTRASAAPSPDDVRAQVAAQDRRELPDKIRFPVKDVLAHTRRLNKNATRLSSVLLAKSRLDPALLGSFGHGIKILEECEDDWDTKKQRGAPKSLKDARTAATKLRSEAVSTLRHYLPDDNDLQVRLDEIMEGDGDADLIDDCKKVAALVDAHWSTIEGRSDLLTERGDTLRKEAAIIAEADNKPTPEAQAALELRDKAYFHLLASEREIRECGRHAFRSRPELAELFADVLGARKGGGKGGSGGGGGAPPAT